MSSSGSVSYTHLEERLREEKTAKVREFYEDNIHDIGKYLPFERVMQPRYALASTTMKSIKEEILALIQKVDEGLAVLNEVDSPYACLLYTSRCV